MTRPLLFTAAWLAMPLLASAQAFRCPDPATGQVMYTDQPCQGGTLVAPRRTEEELRQDAQAAALAREREAEQQALTLAREQQRLQAAQAEAALRAAQAPSPAETGDCRAARAEADFRARSFSATPEQIRTARYNAALACGQPPPSEVIVVQPPTTMQPRYPRPYPPPYGYHDTWRPLPAPAPRGPGFGMPVQPPAPPSTTAPGHVRIGPMPQHTPSVPVNTRPRANPPKDSEERR
ncbi:MAG: hypothetical protein Q4F13_05850 [Pseudomonadota bacterium]|nr:hypothetical protein [Pseudomonadota bacterium]